MLLDTYDTVVVRYHAPITPQEGNMQYAPVVSAMSLIAK